MPKGSDHKKKYFAWIIAVITLILIIISQTAFANTENHLQQGIKSGTQKPSPEAFNHFEKTANTGDIAAQCMPGSLYFQGQGIQKDENQAVQ